MEPMPTERLIELGGRVYRVHASEQTSAPAAGSPSHTFVLVHGIGISHRLFSRLHGLLSRRHTVYSLDLPGFGGLPKPVDSPDVFAMAADIGHVLELIGVRDVVAVGDSMGTQWVVELGVQRPDLVSHVVAIGPVADERHRSALAQAVALGNDTLRETPSANARVFVEYARCGPRWYLRQLPHMLAYPIEDRAAELRRPLMVLRGGRDPIAGPEWSRRLAARAARSRMVEVPGHPHLVQHTAPRAVASAIEWFVDEEFPGQALPVEALPVEAGS
jgi:pimeloyl-ACP methyl ester carboxylesterase